MSIPQQPEIARSHRGEVTAEVASKDKAAKALPREDAGTGPVPEENQPGYHPPVDQDKPQGPPPTPGTRPPKQRRTATKAPARAGEARFPFAVDGRIAPLARLLGVTPEQSYVEVADERLVIRFGPWTLETPLDNVDGASEALVPLGWPAFVTRLGGGVVRIRFEEPVRGAVPLGLLPTRSVTVTVERPDELVQVVNGAA